MSAIHNLNTSKLRSFAERSSICALALCFLLIPQYSTRAASATWAAPVGAANANWSTGTNWSTGAAPGDTNGAASTTVDTGTFSSALTSGTIGGATDPIVIDQVGQAINRIIFTNSAGAYVVGSTGGNTLYLTSGGAIQSSATNTETISAPLAFTGAGYTFGNVGNPEVFAGPISSALSSGTTVLALTTSGGNNNSQITVSGNISDGTSGGHLALTLTGRGALSNYDYIYLSGSNSFTGGVTVNPYGVADIQNAYALSSGPVVLSNNAVIQNTSGNAVTTAGANSWTFPSGVVNITQGTGSANLKALTIGAASTVTLAGTSTVVFNHGGAPLTINAPIGDGGSGYGINVNGGANAAVLNLNGNNTYSGATTINNAAAGSYNTLGFTGTQTSVTPFGTGNINITGYGSIVNSNNNSGFILNFTPAATSGTTSLNLATAQNAQLNFAGNDFVYLGKGTAAGITLNFGNAASTSPVLNRVGNGTLLIVPGDASFGTTDKFIVQGTGSAQPVVTNGMVPAYILQSANGGTGTLNFLNYNSTTGFSPASTTAAFGANNIVSYAGGTVPAGSAAYALSVTGSTNLAGTLTINNGTTPVAGLLMNGGSIYSGTLEFGTSEAVIGTNAGSATIGSVIDGSGGLTKTQYNGNSGTGLTLAAVNTYTGPTSINIGNLTVAAGGAITSPSTLTVSPGATLGNNGTIASPIALSGALTIGGAGAVTTGTVSAVAGSSITYTNTLAAGNTVTTAPGTNTFGTITNNAASGSLSVVTAAASTNTIGTLAAVNGSVTNIIQNGTGTINNLNGSSGSVINLNGTGVTNIANTLGTPGETVSFNGGTYNLTGGGGAFTTTIIVNGATLNTKSDAGNQTNFQQTPNLQILSGTFNFQENNGLRVGSNYGTSNSVINSGTVIQSGGVSNYTNGGGLQLGAVTATAAYTDLYNLSGGIMNLPGLSTISIGAATSGTDVSSFNFSGGKILEASTISGYAGTGAKQSFVWTGGTLAVATYTATNLTSTQGLAVSATTNTLTNGGGILAPGDIGTAGKTTITGNYSVTNPNAALAIDIGGVNAGNAFQNTAASASYDLVTVSGSAALGGRLNVGLINSFTPSNATNFTILTTAANGRTGTFTNPEVSKVAGVPRVNLADGLSSLSVTYNTGSVVLGGYLAANTYAGANGSSWDGAQAANWSVYDPGSTSAPASVASYAIAQFADNAATGTGSNGVLLNSTRNIQGIQFSSAVAGHNYTISDAGNGTGAIILDNTANSAPATISDTGLTGNSNAINVPITLNSNLSVAVTSSSNTLNIGGSISGTGFSLTKTGAGTLIASGSNGYTGATVVQGGKLLVSGSLSGTGSVSVTTSGILSVNGLVNTAALVSNSGGTVQGQGTVGNVSVSNSGALSPGLTSVVNAGTGQLAAGTLTAANVTFDNTSTFNIRLGVSNGGAGGSLDNDALTSTGTVLLNGATLTVNTGSAYTTAGASGLTFIILNGGYNPATSGQFSNGSVVTASNGDMYNIIYGYDPATQMADAAGTDIALQAVPEPGSWALLLGGAGLLAVVRRRRW